MKKLFFIFIFSMTGIAQAGLSGTKHDFVGKSWVAEGNKCLPCHASTQSDSNETPKFRWGHQTTSAHFFTYSSTTLKASVSQPQGSSLFCLSCHDGTVPLNAYGDQTGSTYISNKMGTNLSHIHPISFTYNDSLAAAVPHLRPPSKTPSGLGGTIEEDLLENGKMECTSCHEPHNRFNESALLVRRNGQAGLCGICHSATPPATLEMGSW